MGKYKMLVFIIVSSHRSLVTHRTPGCLTAIILFRTFMIVIYEHVIVFTYTLNTNIKEILYLIYIIIYIQRLVIYN